MDSIDEILARAKPAAAEPDGDPIDAILARAGAPAPSFLQRVRNTATGIANTFAGGAKAVGETAWHPIDTITNPARRHQFERGLADMLTLGYGQKLAARVGNALGDAPDVALGPETFGGGVTGSGGAPVANTQVADQKVAPEFRQLGNLVGTFAPGATSGLASAGVRGARALVPVAATNQALSAALGAVRGMAGYQLAAPATAALSAGAEGNRLGAAYDAATDPVGNALGAGLGAAVTAAPGRVQGRIMQDVPHGESTAKLSVAKKFEHAAGENGEALASMLQRDPKLEKTLAVKAGSSPGRVVKTVQNRIEKVSDSTEHMYDLIDKAPDKRFAGGAEAGRPLGGVDISTIDQRFAALREKATKLGRIEAVGPIDKARAALADAYGTVMEDGTKAIIPGTVLPARSVRNFANGIGEVAFAGDPNVTPKTRVRSQQDLYRTVTGVIEEAAKDAPGVDVAKLKTANRDMSILLPMRDALKERAAKEAVGRTSLYSLLGGTGIGATAGAAAGGAIGGVPGAFIGAKAGSVAGAAGSRVAGNAARTLDYKLMQAARAQGGTAAAAKLMTLARQGASDDEIQSAAASLGIKFAD